MKKSKALDKKIFCYTESIFYAIEQTAIYFKTIGLQYSNELNIGITFEQFITLSVIYSNENIGQRDLSRLILKDHSNTSKILTVLEYKNFITRSIEIKENRMIKKISITESGKKLIEDLSKIYLELSKEFFKHISNEELITLHDILNKLGRALGYRASTKNSKSRNRTYDLTEGLHVKAY